MTGVHVLQARGLGSRHGTANVLADIDLDIAPGEVVGLVGPNGSGKSTLLRCLGGLHPVHAGSVAIGGKPLHAYARQALARAVAYVPQQVGSAMALRVTDMVTLGRMPHRGQASAAQHQALVFDAIDAMQLQPLALRHFSDLSGGERQRVLIARALAQQSQLLLLDEPTSGLDLRHQLAALHAVSKAATVRGVGALVAIHDLALAARFCDRLAMLRAGRLLAIGPWQKVLTPEHVQALFGVQARIGQDGGLPYVITVQETTTQGITQ